MKNRAILLVLFPVVILSFIMTCRDDDPPSSEIKFTGVFFRDEMGNHLGTYGGTDDNDWGYDSLWTLETLALLSFPDTINLAGTYLEPNYSAPDKIRFSLFPNPVRQKTSAYIIMPGKIKIKMAMIDREMNVVFEHAYVGEDTSWTFLDFTDTVKYVEGEVYRMYYMMSVAGHENFYKGHGDILMCSQLPFQCLDYLEEE